jgi:hypothetical protein
MCALGLWSVAVEPAAAAWNNVFQPTLFCRPRTTTSSSPAVVYSSPVVAAAPACNTCNAPPPQPSCSTSYTQRCFYQPVTTFETKTFYEPVTTYRTSFYYEPVVSYRFSNYFDPCTCTCKQVATPVTSYQLRSQSCPVQSWVQRCAQVPVTSYQKACYWEPQTTCCQTTVGALIPAGAAAPAAAPVAPAPASTPAPPSITPTPGITNTPAAPPSINEQHQPGAAEKAYYPQTQQKPAGAPWQPATGLPTGISPTPPPPPVKLDRIVVGPDATVEGQVVRNDNTPRPNAKIVFVSSSQPLAQQTVIANSAGRFQANLAAGAWNVYLHGPDGNPTFSTRIDVGGSQPGLITLVNR